MSKQATSQQIFPHLYLLILLVLAGTRGDVRFRLQRTQTATRAGLVADRRRQAPHFRTKVPPCQVRMAMISLIRGILLFHLWQLLFECEHILAEFSKDSSYLHIVPLTGAGLVADLHGCTPLLWTKLLTGFFFRRKCTRVHSSKMPKIEFLALKTEFLAFKIEFFAFQIEFLAFQIEVLAF